MTYVNCRLTAKNQDQLRNPMLGNRVWATFTFLSVPASKSVCQSVWIWHTSTASWGAWVPRAQSTALAGEDSCYQHPRSLPTSQHLCTGFRESAFPTARRQMTCNNHTNNHLSSLPTYPASSISITVSRMKYLGWVTGALMGWIP